MLLEWNRRLQTKDSSVFDSALGIRLPSPSSSKDACCHCGDGLSDHFISSNYIIFFDISKRALEMNYRFPKTCTTDRHCVFIIMIPRISLGWDILPVLCKGWGALILHQQYPLCIFCIYAKYRPYINCLFLRIFLLAAYFCIFFAYLHIRSFSFA